MSGARGLAVAEPVEEDPCHASDSVIPPRPQMAGRTVLGNILSALIVTPSLVRLSVI